MPVRRGDQQWEAFGGKLISIGVDFIDERVYASQAMSVHEFSGKYGDVPVIVEYHVGSLEWAGWVEVHEIPSRREIIYITAKGKLPNLGELRVVFNLLGR
jgi:hypothetical protein